MFWNDAEREDNEESDADIDDEFKSIEDNIVFLLDSRRSMYEKNSSGEVFS